MFSNESVRASQLLIYVSWENRKKSRVGAQVRGVISADSLGDSEFNKSVNMHIIGRAGKVGGF